MIEHLKSLAIFAKTVEHGSFRAAARALALSPSVVSHHVSELERKLSLALLYRSTRHLALTPDGELLYDATREMLAAAERGLDRVTGRNALTGRLRVTAPALLAETSFCRDLASFARANPNVQLDIGFTERRRDLLRDNLDLALRIGPLDDSGLKARSLAVMTRTLVAAPRYVAEHDALRSITDLATWDFIQLSALRPELALLRGNRKRVIALQPRLAVDSATAMRAMAVAGLGFASLPELIAREDLARGRLVEILPQWRLAEMKVYAVWPGGTQRPGLTLRFVEFIAPRLVALFAT